MRGFVLCLGFLGVWGIEGPSWHIFKCFYITARAGAGSFVISHNCTDSKRADIAQILSSGPGDPHTQGTVPVTVERAQTVSASGQVEFWYLLKTLSPAQHQHPLPSPGANPSESAAPAGEVREGSCRKAPHSLSVGTGAISCSLTNGFC